MRWEGRGDGDKKCVSPPRELSVLSWPVRHRRAASKIPRPRPSKPLQASPAFVTPRNVERGFQPLPRGPWHGALPGRRASGQPFQAARATGAGTKAGDRAPGQWQGWANQSLGTNGLLFACHFGLLRAAQGRLPLDSCVGVCVGVATIQD